MNGYEKIINSILVWAKQRENVRAVIMIGSRARTDDEADEWSDLDLIVVAEDISEYIQTTSWLNEFGAPLVTFTETAFDKTVERRVLFEGFLDVDFDFCGPDEYAATLESTDVRDIFRRGYRVLLDKDDWSSRTDSACAVAVHRQSDSPQAILNEIHDYWYHCVWTTKKLKRGELWTALNCLNCYMKTKLLRMIERLSTLSGEVTKDTWYGGRFLEKWAAPSIVRRLHGCFSDYEEPALRRALLRQMEIYDEYASRVAARGGIMYPIEEVRKIKDWIATLLPAVDFRSGEQIEEGRNMSDTPTTVIIVRHGETEWNLAGKHQGHMDSPLTERGTLQAHALAEALLGRGIESIISSDLGRALATANIIGARLGLSVQIDAGLRERNLGTQQGLTLDEWRRRYPMEWEAFNTGDPDYCLPGGESARERFGRTVGTIEDLARTYAGRVILIVAHGGVLSSVFRKAAGIPLADPRRFSMYNGAINCLTVCGESWQVDTWGEISHLHGLKTLDDN